MPATRNLEHILPLVVKRGGSATSSLEDLGTTAKPPPGMGNPEWLADLEYVWRMRTHDALQRLDQRARDQKRAANRCTDAVQRVTLSRSAEWAEHRAQAMALPRAEVVRACGKRWRKVACGCGTREVPVGCDQTQLCRACSKRHWRKWRRRITRAMDAHVRAARGEWHAARARGLATGKLPGVYLLTLTVPHSGSIAMDRETLARGWRKLTKVATAERWWGAYALTYEVTPGEDGKGHVHAHIAAISSWIPYERLHEVWRAVTGALVLDAQAPRSNGAKSAADYLAKYVTKGVDPAVFTGQKAGELIVAMRGKRKVTTSVAFWRPTKDREVTCKSCGQKHRSLGAPEALRKVAPGPVLRAMAERVGFWIPRGRVQTGLALPAPPE